MDIITKLKDRLETNRQKREKEEVKDSGVKYFIGKQEISEKEFQESRVLQPYVQQAEAKHVRVLTHFLWIT